MIGDIVKMAATIMSSLRLPGKFSCVQNVLFQNIERSARAQTCLEITRGRRRTCKPAPWMVPKRTTSPFFYNKELTRDNRQFLSEVIEDRYAAESRDSPLRDTPYNRHPWTVRTMRCGVLAIKIGVVPQWTKDGHRFHTTMLQVLDNHVIRYTPPEDFTVSRGYKTYWKKNAFGSVVVGALSSDPMLYSKAYTNLFAEAGLPPKRRLTRFLVTPDAAIEPGTPLTASHFKVGDYVDCQAKTIGHGFQGVVKRWGFKGGPASHGTTKWHRRPGNIGGGGDKAAVWKGRKLPGHMGMDWQTLKGLKIWRINTKYNVLYVTGPNLPGPNHCYVRVMDSCLWSRKIQRRDDPPHMPTYYPEDCPEGGVPEEIFAEDLFQFTEPTVMFQEEKKEVVRKK